MLLSVCCLVPSRFTACYSELVWWKQLLVNQTDESYEGEPKVKLWVVKPKQWAKVAKKKTEGRADDTAGDITVGLSL